MTADAVIGSEAFDAGPEELHLATAAGAIRNIPWNAIKFAGMGGQLDDQVEDGAVAERVAPFRATHDSLWIVYSPAGFVRAMIEKTGPRRDAILTAFANHLGNRWRDDELTEPELTGAMLIPPKVRIPSAVMVTLTAFLIVFFAVVAILFFVHGAKPTAP